MERATTRDARLVDAENDERALVCAARTESAAFGVLYRRYHQRIYRFLYARIGHTEEAADLTQQVFVQALGALPRYRERGLPFAAWLFRIARNSAVNARRHPHPTVAWEQLSVVVPGPSDGDPEQMALQREALDRLQIMVQALDTEKRDLLDLRFAAGLTAREIAAVVGGSEVAAQKRLARLIRTLKEQYDDPR